MILLKGFRVCARWIVRLSLSESVSMVLLTETLLSETLLTETLRLSAAHCWLLRPTRRSSNNMSCWQLLPPRLVEATRVPCKANQQPSCSVCFLLHCKLPAQTLHHPSADGPASDYLFMVGLITLDPALALS
jgi:hypothetical protein